MRTEPENPETETSPGHAETAPADESVPGLSETRLVASFGSADQAREAVLALERQGVDGKDIHLLDLARPTGDRQARSADGAMIATRLRQNIAGAAIGAAIGAGLFLLGAALFATDPRLWIFALVGAIFGVIAGAFYGVFVNLSGTEETEVTFAQPEGINPRVLVTSGDDDRTALARRVLAEHSEHPVEVLGTPPPAS